MRFRCTVLIMLFTLFFITSISAIEYGSHSFALGDTDLGYRMTTVGSQTRPSNVDAISNLKDAYVRFYRVRYGVVQRVIPNVNTYSTSDSVFALRTGIPRSFSFDSSVDSVYVNRDSGNDTVIDITWY